MIDKVDFYHGAVILKALEDDRFNSVKKNEIGYIINDTNLVLIKYTTKSKSPWQFTFSKHDLENIENSFTGTTNICVVLICGSDGFCTLKHVEVFSLLNNKPGVISSKRKFNQQYKVTGPGGHLVNRVSFNRWPSILFENLGTINCKEND